MEHPLDGIAKVPSYGQGVKLSAAGRSLLTVVNAMEVSEPELAAIWPQFVNVIEHIVEGNSPIPTIQHARYAFDGIEGDTSCGEYLIGSAKMLLSAFLLSAPNPMSVFRQEMGYIHDDVEPLIEKGLELAGYARQYDPFEGGIHPTNERAERLADSQERSHMENLIRSAIRPKGAT